MTILETNQLTKTFGGKDVVSDINLKIKQGEIYGFLGQNGAGKTTIMKMIAKLVRPTSGKIRLFGEQLTMDSVKVLSKIGSIIEYPTLYGHLTADQTLQLHCEYMGTGTGDRKAIQDSLELVGLNHVGSKPVHTFSLGMKQRLGLARAIVTKPELLMLDEPINGLDPVGIKEMRKLFKTLQNEFGMTLFISSHILGELELIADTVGIIRDGKLVEEIAVKSLHALSSGEVVVNTNDSGKAASVIERMLGVDRLDIMSDKQLKVYNPSVPEHIITKTLVQHNIQVNEIYKKTYSLEQYFLERMNGGGALA